MIDTFACCGKSTGEKDSTPNLFKQAMVKFSFLMTNLTFQRKWQLFGRDEQKHSFLEALRVQIRFGNSECPLASVAPSAGSRLEQRRSWTKADHGGRSWLAMTWLVQQGDKWSLSDYFGETAADSCTAWLSAQAQCIFNAMGLILPFMTN